MVRSVFASGLIPTPVSPPSVKGRLPPRSVNRERSARNKDLPAVDSPPQVMDERGFRFLASALAALARTSVKGRALPGLRCFAPRQGVLALVDACLDSFCHPAPRAAVTPRPSPSAS